MWGRLKLTTVWKLMWDWHFLIFGEFFRHFWIGVTVLLESLRCYLNMQCNAMYVIGMKVHCWGLCVLPLTPRTCMCKLRIASVSERCSFCYWRVSDCSPLLTRGAVEVPGWNNTGRLMSAGVRKAQVDLHRPAHTQLCVSREELHANGRYRSQVHTVVSWTKDGATFKTGKTAKYD